MVAAAFEKIENNVQLLPQVNAVRTHQDALPGLTHIGHDRRERQIANRQGGRDEKARRHSNRNGQGMGEDGERHENNNGKHQDRSGTCAQQAAGPIVIAGAGCLRHIFLERRFDACSAQSDVGGNGHENGPDAVTTQPQVPDHHRDHDDPGQHMHKISTHAEERVLPMEAVSARLEEGAENLVVMEYEEELSDYSGKRWL